MPSILLAHVARLSGAFAAYQYACNTTGEGVQPTRRLCQLSARQPALAGLRKGDALCVIIIELGIPHLHEI
jgi:hypothetical protein